MKNKVRVGLYCYKYEITPDVSVEYCIEFSPESLDGFENKWAVISIIGDNENWFECPFDTKRDALAAIKEVQENGHYKYIEHFGWCYFDN